MVPPSGIGFYTYTLQAMFYVDDADISIDDGFVSVKAKVVNNHSSARKVTMILALKDKYGGQPWYEWDKSIYSDNEIFTKILELIRTTNTQEDYNF